jgi:predicted glycosyltransferase
LERLAPLDLFAVLHPDELTVELMADAIERQLAAKPAEADWQRIDLGAQQVINMEVERMLGHGQ